MSRQAELDEKAKKLAETIRSLGLKLLTCGCCGGVTLLLAGEQAHGRASIEGYDTKVSLGDI